MAMNSFAADAPGLTDDQLKKLIADSAEYKKKALAQLTVELGRARNAPLQGSNRVEAAKKKGKRIEQVENKLKQVKSPNFVHVEPFGWQDMKPGTIGVLHAIGLFETRFEVRRVVNESQAIIEVEWFSHSPQGGQTIRKSERFLISDIATKDLRDGIDFTDERVFQVFGTTKVQGSSMVEIKPFDIEARIAAMKKK